MADMGSPKGSKGFRAMVEKHDQLFTVLGALIVFIGFFAKEVERENTKELLSSIKQAESSFAEQDKLTSLRVALESLASNEQYLVSMSQTENFSRMYGSDKSPEGLQNLSYRTREDGSRQSMVRSVASTGFSLTIELGDRLFTALPYPATQLTQLRKDTGTLLDQLEGSRRKLDQMAEQQMNMTDHLLEQNGGHLIVPAQSPSDMRTLLDATYAQLDYDRNIAKMQTTIRSWKEALLKEAEAQSKKQERRLTIVTWITYALFFVGWSLGLIGKLLRLPALGGSSE
jgi:hypothetical protein